MVLQLLAQALRNVEELKQRVLSSNDLLNDNEALIARLQLQKLYEQVLLLDLEYAINKKVEQDLWNIGFKNYIDILQKLVKDKKNPKRSEYQGLLNVCLESASGFYLILLEEICATFSFSLPFPSYRKYSYLQSNVRKSNIEHLSKQPKKSSCCYICQHCLVHLGDIARYKFRSKQAEIFYRNAIILSPSNGQPYNQLALLETSRGDKLATIFYYVRSIAVQNPFPAATSNLALTLNKVNINHLWDSENKTVLSTTEFVILFLKVHALLHLSTDILPCATYVRLLSTSLTAHVATESFTSLNLVQMMVINMFAYHNVNNEKNENVELTVDEKYMKTLLTEMIAGSFNAFLLPIYTYKKEDGLLQYFALPAIKISLDWIRINSNVLEEPGFVNRPQIWPAFCKLINEIGPLLKSFSHEKYKNVTLPEDEDIQGFIPLRNGIPEYRYSDNRLDLDSLNKLRAWRIRNFAFWLANETKLSLIKICEEESDYVKFNATITGAQSSNELIIQQLEELLKNDCYVSIPTSSGNSKDAPSIRPEINTSKPLAVTASIDALTISSNCNKTLISSTESSQSNKRAGILKTQSFLDKKDKVTPNDNRKPSRQNVALQTILKRNQELEHKQVTFKTPSPSLSTCSDNQESIPSSSVNHSRLWSSGNNMATSNMSNQHLQQTSHSMFVSSFPTYPESFRTLPSHSSGAMMPQQQNLTFNNKNTQFYQQNMNQDIQHNFSPQIYQKPFVALSNDRVMVDQFGSTSNVNNDIRNQSMVENNLVSPLGDNRHVQHQFPSQPNLNFLPPWKQETNAWWLEDKREIINQGGVSNSSVIDDQPNSLFHYRNPVLPSQVSQTSNIPFGGNSQLQFQTQQPPPPHQLRQMSQQTQQQQTHLRAQNSPNVPVGLWPSSYKQPQTQNNISSLFNANPLNKQSLYESSPAFNQPSTVSNSEEKPNFASHSQLPNNTYSLFSPMWNNTPATDNQLNQATNNNPLAVLSHQSIWSEGVSPLQRLLEQQKQMRERPVYHNLQQTTNE